jgi:hypothetical protein
MMQLVSTEPTFHAKLSLPISGNLPAKWASYKSLGDLMIVVRRQLLTPFRALTYIYGRWSNKLLHRPAAMMHRVMPSSSLLPMLVPFLGIYRRHLRQSSCSFLSASLMLAFYCLTKVTHDYSSSCTFVNLVPCKYALTVY